MQKPAEKTIVAADRYDRNNKYKKLKYNKPMQGYPGAMPP